MLGRYQMRRNRRNQKKVRPAAVRGRRWVRQVQRRHLAALALSIVAGGAVIAGTAAVVEIADHWDDVEHGAEAVGDWLNPFNNGW